MKYFQNLQAAEFARAAFTSAGLDFEAALASGNVTVLAGGKTLPATDQFGRDAFIAAGLDYDAAKKAGNLRVIQAAISAATNAPKKSPAAEAPAAPEKQPPEPAKEAPPAEKLSAEDRIRRATEKTLAARTALQKPIRMGPASAYEARKIEATGEARIALDFARQIAARAKRS